MSSYVGGAGVACKFITSSARVGDVKVEYFRGGRGSPLLYLHGLGRWAGWDSDHIGLALRRTVVAPILPGWKSGRLPARVTSVEEYARLLLDFMDSEKIETVDLVGTSLGGWIAIHMALISPERVSRLVLSNAMGLDLPDLPASIISGLSEDDLYAAAFAAKSGMMVATGDFGGMPLNLRESEMFRHIVHGQRNLEVLSGGRCGEAGLAERLGSLSPKTLLLWGDQDEIVPLAHGERMQTLIPGSRLVAIEAAGHCPYKEKPNTFVRLVSDFLLDQEETVAGSRKMA